MLSWLLSTLHIEAGTLIVVCLLLESPVYASLMLRLQAGCRTHPAFTWVMEIQIPGLIFVQAPCLPSTLSFWVWQSSLAKILTDTEHFMEKKKTSELCTKTVMTQIRKLSNGFQLLALMYPV